MNETPINFVISRTLRSGKTMDIAHFLSEGDALFFYNQPFCKGIGYTLYQIIKGERQVFQSPPQEALQPFQARGLATPLWQRLTGASNGL